MPNPVVHWELIVKDAKRQQEFFRDLFDWHVNADNPMNYGLVDSHTETGINGGIATAPDGSLGTYIYVEVDDLQAYLDKAESLGGKTVMPPTEIPDMVTMAMFTDPEGNVVGLVKSEPPE